MSIDGRRVHARVVSSRTTGTSSTSSRSASGSASTRDRSTATWRTVGSRGPGRSSPARAIRRRCPGRTDAGRGRRRARGARDAAQVRDPAASATRASPADAESTSRVCGKASSSIGDLVRREPAELRDVVGRLGRPLDDARGPVEVERRRADPSPPYLSIQTPRNSSGSISTPASSRSSRRRQSSGCSSSSRNPPGRSHMPLDGSIPRRASRTRPSSSTQTALAVGFELA